MADLSETVERTRAAVQAAENLTELSRKTGVGVMTLHDIKHKPERTPSIKTLQALASVVEAHHRAQRRAATEQDRAA